MPRLLLLALLLAACGLQIVPPPPAEWDPAPGALLLRADECCADLTPAGRLNHIPAAQVWGDGRLVWVLTNETGGRRVLHGQLAQETLRGFVERLIAAPFFDWEPAYGAPEGPGRCLTLNLSAESHTVCDSLGQAPSLFFDLYAELAGGLGAAGEDFFPDTGFLTAFVPADDTPLPVKGFWPAGLFGPLSEALEGRWVDAPAAQHAWQIINADGAGSRVLDGDALFDLALQVPGLNFEPPPTETPSLTPTDTTTPEAALPTDTPAGIASATPAPPLVSNYWRHALHSYPAPLLPAPTLTPPPLRVWTTAPPLESTQAEIARQFLSQHLGLAPDQMVLGHSGGVLWPGTQQELWWGEFFIWGGRHSVLLDANSQPLLFPGSDGALQLFPDLATPALAWLGETYGESADTVQFTDDRLYYSASQRTLLWEGRFYRPSDYQQYFVVLDLAGQPAEAALKASDDFLPGCNDWALCGPHPSLPVGEGSNLVFALQEQGGQFRLLTLTQRIYTCAEASFALELTRLEAGELEVAVSAPQPGDCLPAPRPAQGHLFLGPLGGAYNLRFRLGELEDVYELVISPEAVSVRAVQAQFTWPQYEAWRRLPADALWLVVRDVSASPLDPAAYAAAADEFLLRAESDLGAVAFTPEPGVYLQAGFIPPWPGWLAREGWCTLAPFDLTRSMCLHSPRVRYYHYSGTVEPVLAFMQLDWPRFLGRQAWLQGDEFFYNPTYPGPAFGYP